MERQGLKDLSALRDPLVSQASRAIVVRKDLRGRKDLSGLRDPLANPVSKAILALRVRQALKVLKDRSDLRVYKDPQVLGASQGHREL